MKISASVMSRVESRESSAGLLEPAGFCSRPSTFDPRPASAFTLVEIAICLAIIGIALVAIIGVLPLGINVQKDNREETLIDQDATVFIENIRNGARGLDDLTNYVYAITINRTPYNPNGPPFTSNFTNGPAGLLTNGENIIGLLSTPEYTDLNLNPTNNLFSGGYSNYVVAYVRSLSGSAVEKPPQTNAIILGDSFSYKMICGNVPVAVSAAVYPPPLWSKQPYNAGAYVSYILNGQTTYWRATAPTLAADEPSVSSLWAQDSYPRQLTANLHELRLTFLWPLLPNGGTGNGRQTFRTAVAGQIVTNIVGGGPILYFFQPQFFTNAP
jgi:type II secretory pathway pseudopilin PulG